MKLNSVRATNFGLLDQRELHFGGRATVVYGPNEAGKTTLLWALRCALYGLPPRLPYRLPTEDEVSLVAVATTKAVSEITVTCRQASNRTINLAGKGLPARNGQAALAWLNEMCGGLSEKSYSALFGFTLQDLERGQTAIRDTPLDDLIAAGGAAEQAGLLRGIGERLRARTRQLYNPSARAANPAIVRLVHQLDEKLRQIRGAELGEHDLRRLRDEVARLEAETTAIGVEIADYRTAQATIQALLAALPHFQAWRDRTRELQRLYAPLLGTEAPYEPAHGLGEEWRVLEDLSEQCAEIRVTRPAIEKRARDNRCKADQLVEDLAVALPGSALEWLRAWRIPDGVRAGFVEATTLWDEKRQAVARAHGTVRQTWTTWVQARDEVRRLEALTPDARIAALSGRLGTAVADSVEADRLELQMVLRARDISNDLAAMKPAPLSNLAEELVRCQRPAPSVIDTRTVEHAAIVGRITEAEVLLKRQEAECAGIDGELQSLRADLVIPSQEDLSRSRQSRDSLWGTMKAIGSTGGHAAEYEAAVGMADQTADNLLRGANVTIMLGRLARARAVLTELRSQYCVLQAERDEWTRRWQADWVGIVAVPGDPGEMIEWSRVVERIDRRLGEQAADGEIACDLRRRIGAFITEGCAAFPDGPDDLEGLAARIRTRVAEHDRVEASLVAARERRDVAGARLADARGVRKAAMGELEHQRAASAALYGSLGLPERNEPDAMRAVALRIEELANRAREIEAEDREIAKDRDRIAAFDKLVGEVLGRLDLEFGDDAPEEWGVRLHRRARLEREWGEARTNMSGALGNRLTVEEADERLVGASKADLNAEAADLEGKAQIATDRRDKLIIQLDAAMAQMTAGADTGAILRAECEELRAQLVAMVHRYAVVRTAELVFEKQRAGYAIANQPGILTEAVEYLGPITEGRYKSIIAGEQGETTLLMEGGHQLSADRLSTGTREQLYLAVRLAYVQRHCEEHEPLPVIIDDALVNFDNHRLRAALEQLHRVSERTQVILLTCRDEVRDLACDVMREGLATISLSRVGAA